MEKWVSYYFCYLVEIFLKVGFTVVCMENTIIINKCYNN